MSAQTTYSLVNAIGRAGMIADGAIMQDVISTAAEGTVALGCAVLKGTNPRQGAPVAAVALDVDSVLASGGASAATAQTITSASFNGAIGAGRIVPAQQVTLTLNSHTDWDATVMTVRGEDCDGNVLVEDVLIPNGGNATITTIGAFGRVASVYIPAQTGTNGTYTIGTAPTKAEFSRRDILGLSVWQSAHEPYTSDSYVDNDEMPVLRKGRCYVVVEDAVVNGDSVYVRIVTSGGDVPGQLGGEPSASFALIRDAFYRSTAAIDGVAVVEL